jgi:MFS family permease
MERRATIQVRGEFRRRTLGAMPAKLPVTRNMVLLSGGMAALYGMVELSAAVAPITFESVTGLEVLVGLGPAIFLSMAALAAFPAGRAMDRFGRAPVLAGGFGFGILGCVLTGLGASSVSVVAVVCGFVLVGASIGTVMLSRAAAAELADKTVPVERGKILGFGDLLVGLLSAVLATLGGLALATVGLVVLGMMGLALAVTPAFWLLRGSRKHA